MILKIIYVIGFVYASLSSVECLPFLVNIVGMLHASIWATKHDEFITLNY